METSCLIGDRDDRHQPIRLVKRQRTEEDGVDDGEDGARDPMPSASVTIAMAEDPGLLSSSRAPYWASRVTSTSSPMPGQSREEGAADRAA